MGGMRREEVTDYRDSSAAISFRQPFNICWSIHDLGILTDRPPIFVYGQRRVVTHFLIVLGCIPSKAAASRTVSNCSALVIWSPSLRLGIP